MDTSRISVRKIASSELRVTKDELIYKFNKWSKTNGNNILFITGLSGSGKSTRAKELENKYNAVHIELDAYEHARKHFCKYVDEFMDINPKYKKLSESNWKNTKGEDLIDDFYDGAVLYFNWLIEKIRKNYNQLYVIEGIQLFNWGEEIESNIIRQPLIIKLTKPEDCDKRIISRDVNNTDGGRHDLPKLMRHYHYLKYFIKRMEINYELKAYDPPLDIEEIKKYYPDKSAMLLKDPIHKWRAESGIELIHEEPTVEEQKRIWENWQLMTPEMKKISDKKCKELTGMRNEELHYKIMKEKWGSVMKNSKSKIRKQVMDHVKKHVAPLYHNNDKAHAADHMWAVIDYSLKLAEMIKPADLNMDCLYLGAAYHDVGLSTGNRKEHHLLSAEYVLQDPILKRLVSQDEIELIADICKNHRSSNEEPVADIHSQIVADADSICGDFTLESIIPRFYIDRKLANPEMSDDEILNDFEDALVDKYGPNGYVYKSLYLKESLEITKENIKRNKKILGDKKELRKEYHKVIKNIDKKINESFNVGDKFIHPQYDTEVTVIELDSNVYQCEDDAGNKYAIEMDSISESFNDDYLGYVRYTKKEREEMDSNDFAIPELKKFPITDPGNVNDAKSYFRYVPPKYQKSAANRIFDRMVELDMPLQGEGEWTKYLSKDRLTILQHKPRLTAADIEKDAKGKWIIKKTYDTKSKYPLFVILTANPSLMGKTIRGLTGSEFNHASISFDPTLEEMYSFSFQTAFSNGFVEETISQYMTVDTDETPSKYSIYCTFISEVKLGLLQDMLTDFKDHLQDYSYNFKGLVNFLSFKIPKKNDKSMFCSEFVANILQGIDESLSLNKSTNLIAPEDFKELPKFKLIESGRSRAFDVEEFQKKVNKFIKSKEALKFFTESTEIFNLALFKNLSVTKDMTQDSIFKFFAPAMIEPWRGVTAKSFGGIYYDLIKCTTDEDIQSTLNIFYQPGANKYGVEATTNDIRAMKYRLRLHSVIMNLFNTNIDGKLREEIIEVVQYWHKEINWILKLMPKCPQRDQALYELFWDPEIEFTEENCNKNLLMIDLYYQLFIGDLNEESFFDKDDRFSTFSADLPDEVYLLPSARKYPVLNAYMLLTAAELYDDNESYDPVEFIENYRRLYIEYNCTFTLTKDLPLYKHMMDLFMVEIEVEGTVTKDSRDNFLNSLFNETSISKSKYNFEIDQEGTIMISQKEKADFAEHYRDSLRLLKIYKREGNIEGIKKELCRIFYMVKMIEAILMIDSLTDAERKTETILRAKMLSSFSQYIGVVIKEEKDFDFNDYFQKSPYGDALVINIKSIEGTFKILGMLKTILKM